MNAKLRKAKNGTDTPFAVMRISSDGVKRAGAELGRIYWPFAIASDIWGTYTVTHLPSGYAVCGKLPRRSAMRMIERLRATKVDPVFHAPKGRKWEAAFEAWQPIVTPMRDKYDRPER